MSEIPTIQLINLIFCLVGSFVCIICLIILDCMVTNKDHRLPKICLTWWVPITKRLELIKKKNKKKQKYKPVSQEEEEISLKRKPTHRLKKYTPYSEPIDYTIKANFDIDTNTGFKSL